MYDQLLVGVLNRGSNWQHQPEFLLDGERARPAIFRNRLAVDVFHDQVRQTLGCGAAVQQASDVGMVEAGQDLALPPEAPDIHGRVQAAFDYFDGYSLLVLVVIADGLVDGSHAAVADDLGDAVGAETLPDHADTALPGEDLGRSLDRPVGELVVLLVTAKESFDVAPQLTITATFFYETSGPLIGREITHCFEYSLHLPPAFRIHGFRP